MTGALTINLTLNQTVKRHEVPLAREVMMENAMKRAGEDPSVWVVGDLYTIKTSGADTGGTFTLIEVSVPPGSGPPPHVHHREDQAFYIIKGWSSSCVGNNPSHFAACSLVRAMKVARMPPDEAGEIGFCAK